MAITYKHLWHGMKKKYPQYADEKLWALQDNSDGSGPFFCKWEIPEAKPGFDELESLGRQWLAEKRQERIDRSIAANLAKTKLMALGLTEAEINCLINS